MYLDEAGRPLSEPHREARISWASLTALLLALTVAPAVGPAAVRGVPLILAAARVPRKEKLLGLAALVLTGAGVVSCRGGVF